MLPKMLKAAFAILTSFVFIHQIFPCSYIASNEARLFGLRNDYNGVFKAYNGLKQQTRVKQIFLNILNSTNPALVELVYDLTSE